MKFTPLDSGPLYAETLRDGIWPWLVEPWNTASNLLFLLIVIYWWKRLAHHLVFRICLIGLAVGWFGGSLYHGWRDRELWYWMDFLPIYCLVLIMSSVFWHRIKHWILGPILFLICFLPSAWQLVTGQVSSSLIAWGYGGLAVAIFFPLFLDAWYRNFQDIIWALLAISCVLAALIFRRFDLELTDWLPQGTHFLWHCLGALAIHFLLIYISRIENPNSLISEEEP